MALIRVIPLLWSSFYGLMLPSGNDAGAAIAIHMAGSIDAFADMMNEEAKRLGATDTHFMNHTYLHDEDHYNCIRIYLILMRL